MADNVDPIANKFFNIFMNGITLFGQVVNDLFIKKHTTLNPMMIEMAKMFLAAYDKNALIVDFIKATNVKHWDQIRILNEDFLFKSIHDSVAISSPQQVEELKVAYNKNYISNEDKNKLWLQLFELIRTAIKYMQKHPKSFPNVKIEHHNFVWNK